MRILSLAIAAMIATSGAAMADTMAASPKPTGAMHSSSMKSDTHMKSNSMHNNNNAMHSNSMKSGSMKSDHMMASPKPKSTMKP